MTRPSETALGEKWLANFDEPDQLTATLLLDALRVVSLSELWAGLDALIRDRVADGSIESPVLVVPERSLANFGICKPQRDNAVAYEDFCPGADLDATPGSDGFVGMFLRDLNLRNPDTVWLAPATPLEELRKQRCRTVIVVTDYSGTGGQLLTFVGALARNRTIRSWRSRKLVQLAVATFAATSPALERLRASDHIDHTWAIEAAPVIADAPWTEDARGAVIELCQRECRGPKKFALGFGGTGGLLVTQRSAPNNVPSVFVQKTDSWSPLFPGKAVHAEFANTVAGRPAEDSLAELAHRVGQARLGRNERLSDMRMASRHLVGALAIVSGRRCTDASLAVELRLKLDDARLVRDALQSWNFIDAEGNITHDGRSELASHKRGRRKTTTPLQPSDEVYYPEQLR